MLLRYLPDTLYLYILEFLDYEDRIQSTCTCSRFYNGLMKEFVRKLCISYIDFDFDIQQIDQLIATPEKQIELVLFDTNKGIFEESLSDALISVLKTFSGGLDSLQCTQRQYLSLLQSGVSDLCSTRLKLILEACEISDWKELRKDLSVRCRSIKSLEVDCGLMEIAIPYLEKVTSLRLEHNLLSDSIPPEYFSQIHQLILVDCNINDISPFSKVPILEIDNCGPFHDISSLTDNVKIKITDCEFVIDYTNCFTNSRVIYLRVSVPEIYFNLNHWQQVQDLTLICDLDTTILSQCENDLDAEKDSLSQDEKEEEDGEEEEFSLPSTLFRCALEGEFSNLIDYHVSDYPQLRELKIRNNTSLNSLEGLGFENIPVLFCENLSVLTSLEALRYGKTQKFVLSGCLGVTDTSPLEHIPEVHLIKYQEITVGLNHLKNVERLTVEATYFETPSFYEFNKLQVLDFQKVFEITQFDGLEKIPEIWMGIYHIDILVPFLEEGKSIENQIIRVVYEGGQGLREWEELYQQRLYNQYAWNLRNGTIKDEDELENEIFLLVLLRK